jgi:hypothetical protein
MTKATKTLADPELYAPNQQLVRADGSGPAEEGNGSGVAPEPPPPEGEPETSKTSKQSSSAKTDS